MVQHLRINVIYHTNKRKDKNHMIISINTEKSFDKFQHPFIVKTPIKVLMEGVYLNIINSIYDKSKLSCSMVKVFSLKSGTRKGQPFSPLLFKKVLRVLAREIRQEKEIKSINWKRCKHVTICR